MSVDLLLKLRDAHQMAADALNAEIEKNMPVEAKHDAKDFDKLAWTENQGTKGVYYQTTRESNQNNEVFQTLQKILKEHKGFVQLGGFKIWSHQNDPDTIDRRKG